MKVSIIVPVYNVSAYIENCLASIMSQTYKDIECIIIDDASTDDTMSKCERIITGYRGSIHFEILHHAHNRGVSATRNTGIDAAKGEYLFFIDSDDEISSDCIDTLISPTLEDNSIEIVQGSFATVRLYGTLPHVTIPPYKNNQKNLVCHRFNSNQEVRDYFYSGKGYLNIAVWNKLIKKDFLVRHNLVFEEGLLWEDNMWSFFLMKYLCHLCLLPSVTYLYHIRPQSIQTGTSKRKKRQIWGKIYKTIVNTPTAGDEIQEQLYYLPKFCYYYVTEYQDECYQYAYKAFEKKLTTPEANVPLRYILLLKLTKIMAMTVPSRYLFVLCYYMLSKL